MEDVEECSPAPIHTAEGGTGEGGSRLVARLAVPVLYKTNANNGGKAEIIWVITVPLALSLL
jgi:hypothetical protein